MRDYLNQYLDKFVFDLVSADTGLVLLVVLLVIAVIVLDGVTANAAKLRKESGIDRRIQTVSIDGSSSLPVRNYVSDMQGLAGKPDALISENGFIIPIERKPLARKLRDRHVAQLLVYMRLVEEFEGKKPPYGYLILGPKHRRFKIDNTPERQAWLQKMIDEMQAILAGQPAVPAPHPSKCRKCPVRDACAHKVLEHSQTLAVKPHGMLAKRVH